MRDRPTNRGMERNDSTNDQQVPGHLVYNHPRREDFPPQSGSWRNALQDILSSIEQSKQYDPIVLFKTDKYVCTYDKFPKGKYHLLLMRRRHRQKRGDLSHVQTLDDLEPCHLDELQEFHRLGRSIASRIQDFHEMNNINEPIAMKLGYHAIPSLEPLHLHIISSDMDAPCITQRKHILSFTSPLFFVEPESVERHLESAFVDLIHLSVRKERAQNVLNNTPLACTRCKREATTVPDWKRHNQICNSIPTSKTDDTDKLNSLLGWASKTSANKPSKATDLTCSKKRTIHQLEEDTDDIY